MAEFVEVMKQKKRMCETLKCECSSCGLSHYNSNHDTGCSTFILDYYEQAEEIIMKWAKDNPIKTNADKFKEVFGFEADTDWCATKCPEGGCAECNLKNFWKQEYKEPKGETNDRTEE